MYEIFKNKSIINKFNHIPKKRIFSDIFWRGEIRADVYIAYCRSLDIDLWS